MRKRIAVLFLVSAFSAIALTACGGLLDEYKKVISDFRDVVLSGSSENYSVNIISGFREENFSLDGESGGKVDYILFTVTPVSDVGSVGIDVTVGETNYSLICNKHPLGNTYSAELPVRLTADSLALTVNGEAVTAQTVVPGIAISGENALEIAKDALDLDAAQEIYVRIIENPIISDGNYYWYVAAYSDGNTSAVLINVSSGSILAVRK